MADGSAVAGLIGTGVHADIHAIRLTGPSGANRQVWVGCDGGVYLSGSAGKVHTFAPRGTGLAVLEAGFSAAHPTVSHLVAAGMQDNGTQVRTGDTVWEEILQGDGGGVLLDPSAPHRVIAQYIRAGWKADPQDGRFCSPTSRLVNGGAFSTDRENSGDNASFYSAPAAVTTGPGRTRLAVGTNRVWLTDNLGSAPVTTWGVLPFSPAGAVVDQRPLAPQAAPPYAVPPDPAPAFGVPAGALGLGALLPNGNGPLGRVVTLRWAGPRVLVALFENGVVTWTEAPVGTWTASVDLLVGALGAGGGTVLTDVFPIPMRTDYYLTTTGSARDATLDTCYLVTRAAAAGTPPTVTATGLRNAIHGPPAVGPLDPAYAVVVDPARLLELYVGTVTGVWHGVRTNGTTTVSWGATPFVNGLPQAAVQDLAIHYDPEHPTPRLLRAAVQSRGVWEVDLAADEPVRTYVRVHAFDDRRRLPTPLDNPRTASPSQFSAGASPDIVLRPRAGAGITPQWQGLPADQWTAANVPAYELWTFQTAFRWIYPSVQATGEWTPGFEQLVAFDRGRRGLPAGRYVDKALWDAVVATRIDANGAVSANVADQLAVYQPPWRRAGAMTAGATEIDLVETVRPLVAMLGFVTVHDEPCTVDVLLHHRDTRPVPAGQAHALVLHRRVPLFSGTLLTADTTALTAYFRSCAAAPGTVQPAPAGWTLAGPAAGQPVVALTEPLDARVPRALSFDVDLTGTGVDFVEILAAVWSDADRLTRRPGAPGRTGGPGHRGPRAGLALPRLPRGRHAGAPALAAGARSLSPVRAARPGPPRSCSSRGCP